MIAPKVFRPQYRQGDPKQEPRGLAELRNKVKDQRDQKPRINREENLKKKNATQRKGFRDGQRGPIQSLTE